jgi:nucleoside-diphosphate kinase
MTELEYTFNIIKPDALERGMMGRIFSRIEDSFLRISGLQERYKSRKWAEEHYAHLKNEPFFEQLVDFMISRSLVGFVVGGAHAITRMRNIAGATKPWEAAPGSIRGDWGHFPAMFNLIHVSDSQKAAEREIALYYKTETDHLGPLDKGLVK